MIGYADISAAVFLLDYFLKNKVEETVTEGTVKGICGGRLLLRRHHNKGAFLNVGEKKSPVVAVLSVALSLAATTAFLLTFTMKGGKMMKLGLSLLLGGAYSNTYDRLRRKYVVDYVSFPVRNKKIRGIVFNISDFCIMLGAKLMVLSQCRFCP